jgi:hypothetical protein
MDLFALSSELILSDQMVPFERIPMVRSDFGQTVYVEHLHHSRQGAQWRLMVGCLHLAYVLRAKEEFELSPEQQKQLMALTRDIVYGLFMARSYGPGRALKTAITYAPMSATRRLVLNFISSASVDKQRRVRTKAGSAQGVSRA